MFLSSALEIQATDAVASIQTLLAAPENNLQPNPTTNLSGEALLTTATTTDSAIAQEIQQASTIAESTTASVAEPVVVASTEEVVAVADEVVAAPTDEVVVASD